MLEQVRTIDRSRLMCFVGTVEPEKMNEVEKAIEISFGLSTFKKIRRNIYG